MKLVYPATITEITSQNSSFDACMIRVMYTGKNRNKTSISKAAVERAIHTIYNCPIVCNYNIEEDTIGGHDVDVISTDRGIKIVNLTDAIGVIPAGAEYHWEEVTDGDETHEYLCIGGVLWKRTPAYEKIKRDGIEGQSMEIDVTSGKTVDGYYEIEDFSFTAFCILGDSVEPCFESAAIETFSLAMYKQNIARMMEDFKREYSMVITASADDIDKDSLKGGEGKLNVDELMAKYGLSAEEIEFNIDEIPAEELEAKFAEIAKKKTFGDGDEGGNGEGAGTGNSGNDTTGGSGSSQEGGSSGGSSSEGGSSEGGSSEGGSAEGSGSDEESNNTTEEDGDDEDTPGTAGTKEKKFSLTGEQFRSELISVLRSEMIYDDCWECEVPRYWYIDYDLEAGEVYVEDRVDFNLYGIKFTMNGDHVEIDFASATRKKVAFVDFEGESNPSTVFSMVDEIAKERFAAIKEELEGLRKFKKDEEDKQRSAEREKVFAEFADLNGNELFENLRTESEELTASQIEEKCYAIRGRMASVKFSLDNSKPVRTPVEHTAQTIPEDEPYGGIFIKYGHGSR